MSLLSGFQGQALKSKPQPLAGTSSPAHQPSRADRLQVFSRQATRTGNGVRSNGNGRVNGKGNGKSNGKGENGDTSLTARRPVDPEAEDRQPDSPRINVIPRSKWGDGIPPVMGAHLMPSGSVAPISMSKGPGIGEGHLFFYPDEKDNQKVTQYLNAKAGSQALADLIAEAARRAILAKGGFTLVVSGGSLLKALNYLEKVDTKFDKWHIIYADERNVPHSSEDSNHRGAKQAFLSKVKIPVSQIYAIKEGLGVKEAAKEYEGQLLGIPNKVLPRTADGFPVFDMVLLGVGPDGHVASLFPNRKETAATSGWVLPVSDSPKPPPERITLSMPVINSAANVVIVAFGESKAEIVQRAMEVQSLPGALPVQLVTPENGNLQWILDCPAASQLRINSWENSKEFPRNQ
jgi:6-phosphogluconolactonase